MRNEPRRTCVVDAITSAPVEFEGPPLPAVEDLVLRDEAGAVATPPIYVQGGGGRVAGICCGSWIAFGQSATASQARRGLRRPRGKGAVGGRRCVASLKAARLDALRAAVCGRLRFSVVARRGRPPRGEGEDPLADDETRC